MKKAPVAPKTVLETILDWSADRPMWQRDALRRIVAKGRLDAADIDELVALCKQGRGQENSGPQAVALSKADLPANPGAGQAIALISVADVNAVNNLAAGQTLTLEQNGLTVIYGDNGAGKSGYARILKRACRARHAGKIEPNVYAQQTGVPAKAAATITFSVGGAAQPPEKWKDADRPHAVLSAVSVFDSSCASIHIKEKNEVAFRPFGLDVPDELASACQAVKDALSTELERFEKARNPIFPKPSWKDTTAAGKVLSSLRHDTDLRKIAALAALTDEETARLNRLREDLSKNPAKAAAEQTLRADNIKRLAAAVKQIEEKTTNAALLAVFTTGQGARAKREAAHLAARSDFSGEALKGVGGEAWRLLWEAARRYSSEVVYKGQPFPAVADDARCVLCQQPLRVDARERMMRFEEFIQKDTERQAQLAEATARTGRQQLASLSLGLRPMRAQLQEAALQNPELANVARRALAAARLRRYALLRSLGQTQQPQLPSAGPSPVTDLGKLEATLRGYAAGLQKAAGAEERRKLEAGLGELSDRALLGGMLQTVTDEVERLKNIQFLEQCLSDTVTNSITKLGNDIADAVITPKLRDRFQEEIVKLAAEKVRVEIVRSGGKYGSPQYQVRLFAKPYAPVGEILSEGEQTCVALAAFLTELATAAHTSTLVFDDPVSSLDHRWRERVAKRLVEEAQQRQIVVFTHDLIFANDLRDLADEKKLPIQLVTVSRGPSGAGMVREGLPWKAQRVEERIDNLGKSARAAKALYANNQEDDYRKAAVDVYSGLRASWERALEDVAFFRVVQRHRDYIDPKHLKKASALTGADCDAFGAGFKKCCGVIDAHDPSAARNASAPPPDELLQDIQALKDWVNALRDRQKKIA